jgi:hypothetical protein
MKNELYNDRENQCVICWKKINKDKEKYVELKDFNGKKFVSHVFYHLDCWMNQSMVFQNNLNKMANHWLDKIQNMTGGEKIVEIQ